MQLQSIVLSADQENDSDLLAMIGSFTALVHLGYPVQRAPWPPCVWAISTGSWWLNPTIKQMIDSQMDMLLGGHHEALNMIEVGANELPEDTIIEAMEMGHKVIVEICGMIDELVKKAGKEKYPYEIPDTSELLAMLNKQCAADYRAIRAIAGKTERGEKRKALFDGFTESLAPAEGEEPKYAAELIRLAIEDFEEFIVREDILNGNRAGGTCL